MRYNDARMPRPRFGLVFAIVAATLALDQWTKHLAREALAGAPAVELLGGTMTLLFAENSGAFLSLGANLPPSVRTAIFTGLVIVALAAAAAMLFSGRIRGADSIAFALLVGGGVGNVIDRLLRSGRVTDFIYLSAGPLHTGVFNVADMAITGAVIWLALSSLRKESKDDAPPAAPPAAT